MWENILLGLGNRLRRFVALNEQSDGDAYFGGGSGHCSGYGTLSASFPPIITPGLLPSPIKASVPAPSSVPGAASIRSTSGNHDYDDEYSMDSEELKRVRHQEPSSCVMASSGTLGPGGSASIGTIVYAGGTEITIQKQQQQQPPASSQSDIKLILKKLSNIEELLKVVAEQSFNRLAALKQEARGASSVVPSLLAVEPCCLNEVTTPEPSFKFPLRTLKELNKGICSDESLYNKLSILISDEVLDVVTWDDGKMFKLSSLVIFSDSLYVAWFKNRLKYDEYVFEMKDAIEKSHKRFAPGPAAAATPSVDPLLLPMAAKELARMFPGGTGILEQNGTLAKWVSNFIILEEQPKTAALFPMATLNRFRMSPGRIDNMAL